MFRFIIAVDVPGDTLEEAYTKLLERMNANDWETTDEAYNLDGEQIEETELQTSIVNVWKDKNDWVDSY